MLWFIISMIVIGAIAGYLARALVPGKDPMGFWGTVALGVVGSFVGGFLGSLIFGGESALGPAGLIGSIIGAVIALLVYNAVTDRKKVGTRDDRPVTTR
ncbi:MAG: GlsB/YeaQ/YmgE family stress response membrane protein [Actinobacteria bacterium]|nr:GlsB/YeaQ/YmgE family stress response membrane protein [Actinomycetota bacterium]